VADRTTYFGNSPEGYAVGYTDYTLLADV
jgi:hypothetical protein